MPFERLARRKPTLRVVAGPEGPPIVGHGPIGASEISTTSPEGLLSTSPNPANAYATNPYAANANPSVSVTTAPTHTPVANPADADATVVAIVVATIVGRRRVTVAHVTVTTRCYGCGGSSSPISIACTPPASCGLGAPKGKKRCCDDQGGGNCSDPHLNTPFGYSRI